MLMKSTGLAVLIGAALLYAGDAAAERLVSEFEGTGNRVTPEFDIDGPWLLDWRLNGEYESMIAIDITLLEGRTGRHIGQVLHTKRPGNGVKLFNSSGRFKLRIDATLARWHLKIIKITPAEAELYTPRSEN
jgi:hypothetical protein